MRQRTKYAIVGLVLWSAVLGLAFGYDPRPDNLIVSWPVFVLEGLDSVGVVTHRPELFALTFVVESLAAWLLFVALGMLAERRAIARTHYLETVFGVKP